MCVRCRVLSCLAAVAVALPATLVAQLEPAHGELGEVSFETSCPEPAGPRLDRAVALLHHMTYSVARTEFEAIANAYPTCAVAHWGVAMTLFTPLWPTRPSEDDLRRGWIEVTEAREIGGATRREQMFIDAAAAFFDPHIPDYWSRIGRWADASRALYEAFPYDVEAKAFYALSILATAPATGDLAHHEAAAALLSEILKAHPTHPGALHYTVHASDAVSRERTALDVVRRYSQTAPNNPHALHMPTHIFTRLGLWTEVIEGNRRAAAAALGNPAGDRGQWVWDEYPHAIEYLVYGLLQIGDDDAAFRWMDDLRTTTDLQPSAKTAFHLSSMPARYALERRDWAGAARLRPRPDSTIEWDRFPWPEAVTWFARGVGAARTGDVVATGEAESRLVALRDASETTGEDLFARQTEILRLAVSAWRAFGDDRGAEAVDLMRSAASLEAGTPKPPVTPAPTLPAEEMLGDMLLELNRPVEALEAYRRSLEAAPGRFNSLVGAARASRRAGDDQLAASYYGKLLEQVVDDSPRSEVREAAAFVRRAARSPG
jgi:tetratricopeptide (TPR) repeat protein